MKNRINNKYKSEISISDQRNQICYKIENFLRFYKACIMNTAEDYLFISIDQKTKKEADIRYRWVRERDA